MNIKSRFSLVLFLLTIAYSYGQKVVLTSPNQKIAVALFDSQNANSGNWYLQVNYGNKDKHDEIILKIDLGIVRNDQTFSKDLKLKKISKCVLIKEQYTALHGKKAQRSNTANEMVLHFENEPKSLLNVILRVYNDGIAFSYEFPEKKGTYTISDELTA
ncbi:glycoside hydrolase family 97 N-terminal domain-containing protein [Flavobacterium sp. DG2-3]|uniref:glycoside hydrolase family 97 N-terminal domain-containing protein n=1 Tax=Flavobacterium sp. DG2-3 TaxID=3068317 RepID=UPI00273E3008|nr:glycoside hydrolase family 97 N-terminal domain-containing protein [Flavobacterium sp. DG2-3]MDP5200255.1 glycoside hydrolase family 97 N-terminal domain-containing protein [Flavobacterium sp. DG2-3]